MKKGKIRFLLRSVGNIGLSSSDSLKLYFEPQALLPYQHQLDLLPKSFLRTRPLGPRDSYVDFRAMVK